MSQLNCFCFDFNWKTMSSDKNFGLSKEEFTVLLDELKSGNEKLFEEIFLNNFQSTCLYIKNKCNIEYDKAYDITMNTLLEYRIRLLDDKVKYGNLKYLFRQMAYHNFVKTVREKKKEDKALKLKDEIDDNLVKSERKMQEILDEAYDLLGLSCRNLLDKFYHLGVSYDELANDEGVSYQAIRKRKERCLGKLKVLIKSQFEKYDIKYEQFRRIFE